MNPLSSNSLIYEKDECFLKNINILVPIYNPNTQILRQDDPCAFEVSRAI